MDLCTTTLLYASRLSHRKRGPFESRIAFAAAHVVIDSIRTAEPLTHPVIDWEATLAYREYLWSLGFGVAEAMDTAQRGAGTRLAARPRSDTAEHRGGTGAKHAARLRGGD